MAAFANHPSLLTSASERQLQTEYAQLFLPCDTGLSWTWTQCLVLDAGCFLLGAWSLVLYSWCASCLGRCFGPHTGRETGVNWALPHLSLQSELLGSSAIRVMSWAPCAPSRSVTKLTDKLVDVSAEKKLLEMENKAKDEAPASADTLAFAGMLNAIKIVQRRCKT